MALLDCYTASQNLVVQQRIQAAAHQVASTVYNEATTVVSHGVRAAQATRVLNGVVRWDPLIMAVCAAGITGNSTDSDIVTAVANLWSAWSGV